MKKLKLHPDELAVESFPTAAYEEEVQPCELLATRSQACAPFSVPPRCS